MSSIQYDLRDYTSWATCRAVTLRAGARSLLKPILPPEQPALLLTYALALSACWRGAAGALHSP
jgi:hypothetical protein